MSYILNLNTCNLYADGSLHTCHKKGSFCLYVVDPFYVIEFMHDAYCNKKFRVFLRVRKFCPIFLIFYLIIDARHILGLGIERSQRAHWALRSMGLSWLNDWDFKWVLNLFFFIFFQFEVKIWIGNAWCHVCVCFQNQGFKTWLIGHPQFAESDWVAS